MRNIKLQAAVENLTFSEISASKPMEPSKPAFAVPSASAQSQPPPSSADRPPVAAPPAAAKAPDIDKTSAAKDDKVRECTV